MEEGRIRLRERVTVHPQTFGTFDDNDKKRRRPQSGTVVYIHPRGRFCTVEFKTDKGAALRESFQLCEGRIADE